LKSKGSDVWIVGTDTTIYEALALMAEQGVGALVVMDNGRVIGLFSERDHARKVDLLGLDARRDRIDKVMETDICYITPDETVDEAMAVMTESRCRHLPVMENDRLVGLVSIGDMVKAALDEKDFVIKQLKQYIESGG
jgi:CBS domain-containing protein